MLVGFARCLFVLLTLVFVCRTSASGAAEIKKNSDYCKPNAHDVVFLVDITTPYDQTDKNEIVRLTDSILSSLTGGDRIIVRTIGDSHTHSELLIARCIPFCADAETTMGKFFYCSDGRLRTETQEVRAAIVASLRDRLARFEELQYSDIVRTINTVALEEKAKATPLTIYIYSDLIENSDYFSSRYLFSYPLSRLIYGVQYYKLVAPLKDAEIFVSGVGRAGTADRRPLTVAELNKLTEFWKAYFQESGAKSVTIGQNSVR